MNSRNTLSLIGISFLVLSILFASIAPATVVRADPGDPSLPLDGSAVFIPMIWGGGGGGGGGSGYRLCLAAISPR